MKGSILVILITLILLVVGTMLGCTSQPSTPSTALSTQTPAVEPSPRAETPAVKPSPPAETPAIKPSPLANPPIGKPSRPALASPTKATIPTLSPAPESYRMDARNFYAGLGGKPGIL